jgi:hypothetical protein
VAYDELAEHDEEAIVSPKVGTFIIGFRKYSVSLT